MGSSLAHGPSAGSAEANSLPEAHGPPKVYGPRGHCIPLLSVALIERAIMPTFGPPSRYSRLLYNDKKCSQYYFKF